MRLLMKPLGLLLVLGGCSPGLSDSWWNQPVSRRTQQAAPAKPVQQTALPSGMIEVVKGDTVHALARRHNVAMRDLIDANRLEPPFKLLIGQRLRLPTAFPAPVREPVIAAPEPTLAARPGPVPESLIVPEPRPKAGKGFLWPLKGSLLAGFGSNGKGLNNDGINIQAKRGAYVRASENGVVVYAGSELKGFGNLLLIKHQDGWVSAYAHNEILLVGRGDRVERGQSIARVGATGNVKHPQLHFELRRESKPVDPLSQLVEG
ncbi:MAG: M23 family metallopeptidase [Alphaproteobacteria bacterium]|nr:M23 family metallopeptidase [Alphaproteobacteria bacterium]